MNVTAKPFDAGDEEHVQERQRDAKAREAARRAGLRKIMADAECRLWLYDHLEACGVFQSSFTGNSETFMREGQRNMGLRILADIHRDHDQQYVVMCREAKLYGAAGFKARAMKDNGKGSNDAE